MVIRKGLMHMGKTAKFLQLHSIEEQIGYIEDQVRNIKESRSGRFRAKNLTELYHAYQLAEEMTQYEKGKPVSSQCPKHVTDGLLDALVKVADSAKNIRDERGNPLQSYVSYGDVPDEFKNFAFPDLQKHSLNQLIYYTRLDEQRSEILRMARVMRDPLMPRDGGIYPPGPPETKEDWQVLCEAVRMDEHLQDPRNIKTQVLNYFMPDDLAATSGREVRRVKDSYLNSHYRLADYLERNSLPKDYGSLVSEAKAANPDFEEKFRVNLNPKTIHDVPFDERIPYAKEHNVDAYNLATSAMMEAWAVENLPDTYPGITKRHDYETSLFSRMYDMLTSDYGDERLEREQKQLRMESSGHDMYSLAHKLGTDIITHAESKMLQDGFREYCNTREMRADYADKQEAAKVILMERRASMDVLKDKLPKLPTMEDRTNPDIIDYIESKAVVMGGYSEAFAYVKENPGEIATVMDSPGVYYGYSSNAYTNIATIEIEDVPEYKGEGIRSYKVGSYAEMENIEYEDISDNKDFNWHAWSVIVRNANVDAASVQEAVDDIVGMEDDGKQRIFIMHNNIETLNRIYKDNSMIIGCMGYDENDMADVRRVIEMEANVLHGLHDISLAGMIGDLKKESAERAQAIKENYAGTSYRPDDMRPNEPLDDIRLNETLVSDYATQAGASFGI